jgi:STAS domain
MSPGYIFFGSMVELGRRLKRVADGLAPHAIPTRDLLRDAGFENLDSNSDGASVDGKPSAGNAGDKGGDALVRAAEGALRGARRFLLLDLRRVTGIDATAASSFAMLRRSLENRGVTMVLTGVAGHESVRCHFVLSGTLSVGFGASFYVLLMYNPSKLSACCLVSRSVCSLLHMVHGAWRSQLNVAQWHIGGADKKQHVHCRCGACLWQTA